MIRTAVALFALLLPVAAVEAVPARHAPAAARHVDWTRVVAATTDGGIRMGNPDAKVKLIEFFSFTCPHCAAFAGEAYGPITQKYVATGNVSFELRSALRDGVDMVAAKTARCAAPAAYFAAVEDVMAAQTDWEQKAVAWIPDHRDDLNGPNKSPALRALVANAGLQAIVAKHGVTPAQLGGCLDDPKLDKILEQTTNDAWNVRKIGGTPGFVINGTLQDGVYTWSALESKIQAALNG